MAPHAREDALDILDFVSVVDDDGPFALTLVLFWGCADAM